MPDETAHKELACIDLAFGAKKLQVARHRGVVRKLIAEASLAQLEDARK